MLEQPKSNTSAPGPAKSKSIWLIFGLVVIALIIVGAYLWWSAEETNENTNSVNQAVNDNIINTNAADTGVINTNTTDTNSANANTNNANMAVNTNAAQEISTLFQAAINQSAYDLAADYMAETVYFVKEATECCGNITASQAVSELSYIDGVYFDFSQDQLIVKKMKANLGDYGFANETVGIAETKQVISYHINANNKVDKIYLNISYDLLDLE